MDKITKLYHEIYELKRALIENPEYNYAKKVLCREKLLDDRPIKIQLLIENEDNLN